MSTPTPVTTLYGGEVSVARDQWHRYWITDQGETFKVPGVTSVIGCLDKSAQLKQWAANQTAEYVRQNLKSDTLYTREQIEEILKKAPYEFYKVMRKACDIGKSFHSWIEQYVRSGFLIEPPFPGDPQAANSCRAVLKYLAQQHFEPIGEPEVFLYSRKHRYAGQSDVPEVNLFAAGMLGGRRALIDWKSSRGIYATQYRPQTAAYLEAYREQTGIDVQDRLVIRGDKETAEFETKLFEEKDQAADFKAFLNLKGTYEWMKEIEAREPKKQFKRRAA